MAHVYRYFIQPNTAPKGATKIGVYDSNGKQVCTIPLGKLTPPNTQPLYSFGLVSDMHLYPHAAVAWTPETKLDNALTLFESWDCAFCAHCGDFTQTGLFRETDTENMDVGQFAEYKSVCDNHKIPVYGTCGNHESYVNPIENNLTELEYYTGTALTYTVEQGEDLFIFIGQPSATVVMSDSDFQWLGETLKANSRRRCFVFVHSYIEEDSGDPGDHRENSIFEFWGTSKTNAFVDLLNQYENVVLFHGHSHMKFECQELDKAANYTEKNGFKSVHVPSLGRPRNIDTTATNPTPYADAEAQGYIVDVYDDCIMLNGWDFVGNKPVPLGTYKIPT